MHWITSPHICSIKAVIICSQEACGFNIINHLSYERIHSSQEPVKHHIHSQPLEDAVSSRALNPSGLNRPVWTLSALTHFTHPDSKHTCALLQEKTETSQYPAIYVIHRDGNHKETPLYSSGSLTIILIILINKTK